MSDPFDEDADVRAGLSVLPPAARTELERVLQWPAEKRDRLLQQMVARPDLDHLATLIAMTDAVETIRLRLLRALRDVSADR
ncbi:MAG: hypothetical protein ACJ768_04700 [Gaiellaceae bacterium]